MSSAIFTINTKLSNSRLLLLLVLLVHSRALSRAHELRQLELKFQKLEAELLLLALPGGFNADQPKDKSPQYKAEAPLQIRILAQITGGAMWGVLARRGLVLLTEYDGAYLGGVVWANFAPCLVMGMLVNSEVAWSELVDDCSPDVMFAAKSQIPLYVGLTTGFCGTCSSFSSFILQAFEKATNADTATYRYPNPTYGILEALAVTLAHLGISVAGFHAGRHATRAFDKLAIPRNHYVKIEWITSVFGIAAYVISIVLLATENHGTWRSWAFSCLFAPWAAIARYLLSKHLNPLVKNFPIGTFTCNIVGCILLAIFTLLARGRSHLSSKLPIVSSVIGCHVLVGLDDGFCGTFTTISTLVVELFGLDSLYDYRYGGVLVISGFASMVVILGSYNWTVGLTRAVCS